MPIDKSEPTVTVITVEELLLQVGYLACEFESFLPDEEESCTEQSNIANKGVEEWDCHELQEFAQNVMDISFDMMDNILTYRTQDGYDSKSRINNDYDFDEGKARTFMQGHCKEIFDDEGNLIFNGADDPPPNNIPYSDMTIVLVSETESDDENSEDEIYVDNSRSEVDDSDATDSNDGFEGSIYFDCNNNTYSNSSNSQSFYSNETNFITTQ